MKKIILYQIFVNCENTNNEGNNINKNPIVNDEKNTPNRNNKVTALDTKNNNTPIEKIIFKKKLNRFEDIRDIFYETGEYLSLSKKDNNCNKSFNEEIKNYSDIRKLYDFHNIKEKGFYPLNLNEKFLSEDGSTISFTDFIKKNPDKNFIFFFKNYHTTDNFKKASKQFFEEFKTYKNCYWNSSFFSDLGIPEKNNEGYIHEEINAFADKENIKSFIYKIFNLKKKKDLINFMSFDKNFKESIFNLEDFLNELKKKKVIFQISYDKNKKYNSEERPIQEIIEASPIYQEYKDLFEITYT